MNSVSIILCQVQDVESLREIQKEVWLATYPNEENGITTEAIQTLFADKDKSSQWINQVKQAITTGESVGWIATVQGIIVGYCFIKKMENKNRILSLYVLPQYQKQGIGKALMEKMLEWIENTKPIVLEVAAYNTNAINFYKSFGFKENVPIKNEEAALQTGIVIPEIEMIKE